MRGCQPRRTRYRVVFLLVLSCLLLGTLLAQAGGEVRLLPTPEGHWDLPAGGDGRAPVAEGTIRGKEVDRR